MSARRILIAALLPTVLFAYACSSGGEGAPPDFTLGLGEEKTSGGNVTAPAPAFGPAPAKSSGNGDGGQTEETGTADTARPDTRPVFDTAGFDTEGLDLGI
jgi:hypothetical protein